MPRIIFAVFLLLHGLVHFLYLGQSARLFELQPGVTWPSGSWLLTKAVNDGAARILADVFCAVAAVGFVLAAAGLILNQPWWRSAVTAAAVLSSLLFVLFWNGQPQRLDQQGAVAILINAAIVVVVLLTRWP